MALRCRLAGNRASVGSPVLASRSSCYSSKRFSVCTKASGVNGFGCSEFAAMTKILVRTSSWTDKTLIESGKFYPPSATTPEDPFLNAAAADAALRTRFLAPRTKHLVDVRNTPYDTDVVLGNSSHF